MLLIGSGALISWRVRADNLVVLDQMDSDAESGGIRARMLPVRKTERGRSGFAS